VVAASAGRARFAARLAALFALVALTVGAVGVYGVVAYQATARTRELGVRAALGATAGSLRRMVLADGGRLAAWGVALGLAAAVASTRLLGGLLYGVSPLDLAVLVTAPAALALVALLASAIPAWRASRVDPTVALRAE
jgi:ABC-type antimicrobial peptide transport system permease subunit